MNRLSKENLQDLMDRSRSLLWDQIRKMKIGQNHSKQYLLSYIKTFENDLLNEEHNILLFENQEIEQWSNFYVNFFYYWIINIQLHTHE